MKLAISLLLLSVVALVSAQIDCNKCRVVGTSPFCGGKCSDCNSELEVCYPSVGAGTCGVEGCMFGTHIACCPKAALTKAALVQNAVNHDSFAVDLSFDPLAFATCVASKLGISVESVSTCAFKCTTTPSCYASCLDLSLWKVIPAVGACLLSKSAATNWDLTPFNSTRSLADLERLHMGKPNLSASASAAAAAPLGGSVQCGACTTVIGKLGKLISSKGCGFLARVELAAECEAIFLGPEDPLADVCVAILQASCQDILNWAQKGLAPQQICADLHFCVGPTQDGKLLPPSAGARPSGEL